MRSPAAKLSPNARVRQGLRRSCLLMLAAAGIGVPWTVSPTSPGIAQGVVAAKPSIWTAPELGALPDDEHGRLVRRGRDLITATYAHIGPEVAAADNRYAGNNLACGNCHLEAGTKKFALPIFGLFGEFPRYTARTGAEVTIEERVNSCMTRSMNGRAMPPDAPQMRAIEAYIKFLSTGVPPGQELPGLGAGRMPELAAPPIPRAAASSTTIPAPTATARKASACGAACRRSISAI